MKVVSEANLILFAPTKSGGGPLEPEVVHEIIDAAIRAKFGRYSIGWGYGQITQCSVGIADGEYAKLFVMRDSETILRSGWFLRWCSGHRPPDDDIVLFQLLLPSRV
jgi:hypothetical protein